MSLETVPIDEDGRFRPGISSRANELSPAEQRRLIQDQVKELRRTQPELSGGGAGRLRHLLVSGLGVLAVAAVLIVAVNVWQWLATPSGRAGPPEFRPPGARTSPPIAGQVTGSFVRWEPVDDSRGYAYFSVTNRGQAAAVATCTVVVKDDFGSVGFDYMTGETVAPGATVDLRMALAVSGQGSYRVSSGEIKDC